MIKSFIAVTREIDDPKTAAEEIIKIINPQKNLLKNSIGIVSCFSEFEESGALNEICASLPFETIGATTCLCSTGGETDQVIFAVTVLTSDDCDFKTVKIPLTDAYDKSVASVLTPFLNEREEKPALILSYFPLMNTVSGDMI